MNEEQKRVREHDPLYAQARSIVLDRKRASISLIQRELRIGYNHAARLLEAMEGDVVTPMDKDGMRHMLGQEGGAA